MSETPEDDRRQRWPIERGVGYGVAHENTSLDVGCGTCKVAPGQPCTRRGGGSHAPRMDKASTKHRNGAYRLFLLCEEQALRADPSAPLWWFDAVAHRCGTLGAHRYTDCRPPEDAA